MIRRRPNLYRLPRKSKIPKPKPMNPKPEKKRARSAALRCFWAPSLTGARPRGPFVQKGGQFTRSSASAPPRAQRADFLRTPLLLLLLSLSLSLSLSRSPSLCHCLLCRVRSGGRRDAHPNAAEHSELRVWREGRRPPAAGDYRPVALGGYSSYAKSRHREHSSQSQWVAGRGFGAGFRV